jgi:hypothetical protein
MTLVGILPPRLTPWVGNFLRLLHPVKRQREPVLHKNASATDQNYRRSAH